MEEVKVRPSVRYGSAKMAVDVNIDNIEDYLCDIGPHFCPRCPSRCAYGRRYLKEVFYRQDNTNMVTFGI